MKLTFRFIHLGCFWTCKVVQNRQREAASKLFPEGSFSTRPESSCLRDGGSQRVPTRDPLGMSEVPTKLPQQILAGIVVSSCNM